MVAKRFEKLSSDFFIPSLAIVGVCEEIIPEEKADVLEEIILLAQCLIPRWQRVWILAERRLEVIEDKKRLSVDT